MDKERKGENVAHLPCNSLIDDYTQRACNLLLMQTKRRQEDLELCLKPSASVELFWVSPHPQSLWVFGEECWE